MALESLPKKQGAMQDNKYNPSAYAESQSDSHLLSFLCTEQDIYMDSRDCIGSGLTDQVLLSWSYAILTPHSSIFSLCLFP